MVDYHKKYLKYKQKHLMSKMNTFTGGTTDNTIKSINTVVTEAAKATKIINKDGTLTSLTQMKFKDKSDDCNNTATLIKQVPCLSVKINTDKDGFDLERNDDVVTFLASALDIDFTIGGAKYKAKINNGQITDIKVDPASAGPPPAGQALVGPPPAGSLSPLVDGEYIITLTDAHLQIDEANMHNGENLKKCTITFNIVPDKTTTQLVQKIDYNSVKLEIES